jgi:RNA polymerase sigma-70 factor (ECF subfamily)
MNDSTSLADDELLLQLKEGNVKSFEILFYRYYEKLCQYSFSFVHSKEVAEEIVSGMFTHIWEKRKELVVVTSTNSYLYAAVKNASLNYLKSQFARHPFLSQENQNLNRMALSPAEEFTYQELETIIGQGINLLPEKCRIIFTLSRQAGLTYEEIATQLGISPKTVKAQMGIALHKLRIYVDRHWDKLLVILVQML